MRHFPLLPALVLCPAAFGQTRSAPAQPQSLFNSTAPDVTITIKKHPMGADLIEITMKAAGYPLKLLEDQIKSLGAYLHSDPRGLSVEDYLLDPSNPNSTFSRANF